MVLKTLSLAFLLLFLIACSNFSSADAKARCESKLEDLGGLQLFQCANCYAAGSCGLVKDFSRGILMYERAGSLGMVEAYSAAAWMILENDQVEKYKKRFFRYLQMGADSDSGLSAFISSALVLAKAKNDADVVRAYRRFESEGFSGGLPASFFALYYMLEASNCADERHSILLSLERLFSAERFEEDFSFSKWNQPKEPQAVLATFDDLIFKLDSSWDKDLLASSWCEAVDKP